VGEINLEKRNDRKKVLWYRGVSTSQTIVSHAEIIWELPSI